MLGGWKCNPTPCPERRCHTGMIAQTVALLSECDPEFDHVVVSAVFGCTHHGGPEAAKHTNRDFIRTIMNPPRLPKNTKPSAAGVSEVVLASRVPPFAAVYVIFEEGAPCMCSSRVCVCATRVQLHVQKLKK